MVLAEHKKRDNISEYLIYLYQSEDLVRTFQFDLNQINTYVISHFPINSQERKEILLWYASLIETMQKEGIETTGHLKEAKDLVYSLTNLHSQLNLTDKDYKKIFVKAEPFILKQIKESNNTIENPIQICLNAVYGLLLIKLNGKSVNEEQQKMLETFGDMLSFLSFRFKQDQFLSSN